MKIKLALIFLLIVILSLFHPYNGPQNAGISFGISDTCQVGYEYRGDVGFFAYCDGVR